MKRLSSTFAALLLLVSAAIWTQIPTVSWPACPDTTPGYNCGPSEIDDSVRLLYHFDEGSGATPNWTEDCSGSTNAPHDWDEYAATPGVGAFRGNAQIHEDSAYFGTSGLSLDGTGDFVMLAFDIEFQPRTSDFTFECWTRVNPAMAGNNVMFGSILGAPDILFGAVNGYMAAYNISEGWTTSVTTDIRDGNWHHLVWARSGVTLLMFVDGSLEIADPTWNDDIWDPREAVFIGYNGNNDEWFGDVDEIRYTIGVCHWTENFSVPTEPY